MHGDGRAESSWRRREGEDEEEETRRQKRNRLGQHNQVGTRPNEEGAKTSEAAFPVTLAGDGWPDCRRRIPRPWVGAMAEP